jgi:hypothetical protein
VLSARTGAIDLGVSTRKAATGDHPQPGWATGTLPELACFSPSSSISHVCTLRAS